MCSRAAARPKCSSSASATTYRKCLSSINARYLKRLNRDANKYFPLSIVAKYNAPLNPAYVLSRRRHTMSRTRLKQFFTLPVIGILGSAFLFFNSYAQQSVRSGIEKVDYNWDVKPILSDNCFRCHGPDANARQAGLRLDIPETAYGVIARGKPNES